MKNINEDIQEMPKSRSASIFQPIDMFIDIPAFNANSVDPDQHCQHYQHYTNTATSPGL